MTVGRVGEAAVGVEEFFASGEMAKTATKTGSELFETGVETLQQTTILKKKAKRFQSTFIQKPRAQKPGS